MITKHFFKILFVFLGMLILGLLGVFLVGFLNGENNSNTPNNAVPIAK